MRSCTTGTVGSATPPTLLFSAHRQRRLDLGINQLRESLAGASLLERPMPAYGEKQADRNPPLALLLKLAST